MEVWKDVIGYEGQYKVSDLGRVKSLKFNKIKFLKAGKNGHGYMDVALCVKGKPKTHKVHQLVAVAFLNHTPCLYKIVVNHIDFDRTNNNVNNLELVSNRENCNNKHLKSTSKYTGVGWDKHCKKWKSQIYINGISKHLGSFTNEIEASNAYQTALKKIKNV